MIHGFLQFAGSLGMFLYGMKIMSNGIQKAAGEKLRNILNFMTVNRMAAVITGFIITGLIQSSSATTVMVVSFVNAGLFSLTQAIGVIMGANIGTTVTGWIVALIGFKFKISAIALPSIAISIPFLFSKKIGKKDWGEVFVGFGLLFLGLDFLKKSVPDINSNTHILEFLSGYTGPGFSSFLLFVIAGTLLTIIVQSSSAAMAITLTMAHAGWIDFPTAAAIVLGENIGTTITAYLASIGTNTNAKRASRAHTLFNVLGVVWMAFLFYPFLKMVDILVPGDIWGPDASRYLPAHLAMFHTLFNVINTGVFIAFIPQLTFIVKKLVKPDKEEISKTYQLKYISTAIQDTPEINILKAKLELSKMAGITEEMFSRFLIIMNNPEKKMKNEVHELKEMEDYTDQMQEQISAYLIACSSENLNDKSITNVNAMIRIIDELESIGDSCFNLIILAQRMYEKNIKFNIEAIKEITPYTKMVQDFIKFIKLHLNEHMPAEELEKAWHLEKKINLKRNTLKKSARKRLQKGADIKAELLFIDMVKYIEHIGDYSLNISESLRQIQ